MHIRFFFRKFYCIFCSSNEFLHSESVKNEKDNQNFLSSINSNLVEFGEKIVAKKNIFVHDECQLAFVSAFLP